VNSEELELSLRTEFESYLKNFRAEIRQQATELQSKLEADMEQLRSHLNEAFSAYAERFDGEHTFDEGFKASVVEHLRQARDEGAALTAAAMDEASHFDQAAAAPADFSAIRDAINDISQHRSQAAILKALVDHASNFAPRGAFFIIKNEHVVGWKAFGTGEENSDAAMRDISFPLSSDSILCDAVRTLATADGTYGTHENDNAFLEALHFGQPDRMHAIPLVARGRGVAVLYADYGTSGLSVNVEALEAITKIAGLTVELLASSQTAKAEERQVAEPSFEEVHHEEAQPAEPQHVEEARPAYEEPTFQVEEAPAETTDFSFAESVPAEAVQEVESPFAEPVAEEAVSEVQVVPEEAYEEVTSYEPEPAEAEPQDDTAGEIIFDAGESLGSDRVETSPFDTAADLEPAGAGVGVIGGRETAVEVSPIQPPAKVGRSRRDMDLPIEVSDAERRPHNDARRFARLLVSEIKLYNEQRVTEGRQAGDLYQRLREAIDRSREMYDKRVQPPVAEKFDYFHYELVNSLADGNADRLGAGYPGASV
jgi:hypothetical protein